MRPTSAKPANAIPFCGSAAQRTVAAPGKSPRVSALEWGPHDLSEVESYHGFAGGQKLVTLPSSETCKRRHHR